ncbi:DUF2062 domain-containing protein [Rufibacter immobilis]|uniref:DUF2062 domain-containing protein n=1 Tax=Rufibacter immobilis TaxID=1348778 RepID=A0A3M9MPS3_9BACT|nr:DUF2062 domain-containing protein [Rufibacter immobilis]RNI27501.1 DUF2062 domain-containing protein [Rufibacter immobilis]
MLLLKKGGFRHFLRRKLWEPLLDLAKQGFTPHQLALTIALGSGFGMIPFIGLTTVLCTFWALRLRLNVAFTIVIGYLMQPFQLALYVPFVDLGQTIFPVTPISFTLEKLSSMFQADWLLALQKLWLANLVGIFAWLLCFIPFGLAVYFSSRKVLHRVLPTE